MMTAGTLSSGPRQRRDTLAWLLAAAFCCSPWGNVGSRLLAQSVGLPAPRLLTTTPMGAKAGTQVELSITGENLADAEALLFSDHRITATPKLNAAGKPEPNKYVVTVAPDCPTGVHDARVLTRLGISSSRAFSIGKLAELVPRQAHTTLATAMELPVNSICNATMSQRAVDHFVFAGRQGQRIIVDCAARGIDSKLDPVVILADSQGRDLLVERRGGAIDFSVPADGRYVIKVHDLTFRGGPAYFYRLGLWELPTGESILRQPGTQPVNSFSWPPQGLPEEASTHEREPNNDRSQVQRISLPCDIAGSFFPAADVDVFEFAARQGETWWVEVASERLGLPTDPAVLVQQVRSTGDRETLVDVAEFSDIPSPVKVSSNGYAYDGPPYNAGSSDLLGKFEVKEDGLYRLQLADLFGGTRSEPRNAYRLVIRKAAPDFALLAWGLHMELRNGDRNAVSKPLALRGGGTMALEVVALRRDGFDGEIDLEMTELPPGVTAHGIKIPAGQSRGLLLVSADQSAPRATKSVNFSGRATIGGQQIVRPCRVASVAWPVLDSWSEIPYPRLLADVPLSVSGHEFAPLTIAPPAQVVQTVTAGAKLTVPLFHTRRSDFSGATMQLKTMGAGFERSPPFSVSLTANESQAVIDTAALKTLPGDYWIAFYGSAVVKYLPQLNEQTADAKTAATPQDIVDIIVSQPIAIRIEPAEKK